MKFIHQDTPDPSELLAALGSALATHERVLWLISGGSNIALSVAVMNELDEGVTERLVIMQTDERYVAPDSSDCNWRQLVDAGFDPKQATTYPVIERADEARDAVVARFGARLAAEFDAADIVIGQFGIGGDGHTAGVKPHSVGIASQELACGYTAADFERVSMTLAAICHMNQAFIYAFGDDKYEALQALIARHASRDDQPAAIFWDLTAASLFSDQIENI